MSVQGLSNDWKFVKYWIKIYVYLEKQSNLSLMGRTQAAVAENAESAHGNQICVTSMLIEISSYYLYLQFSWVNLCLKSLINN